MQGYIEMVRLQPSVEIVIRTVVDHDGAKQRLLRLHAVGNTASLERGLTPQLHGARGILSHGGIMASFTAARHTAESNNNLTQDPDGTWMMPKEAIASCRNHWNRPNTVP